MFSIQILLAVGVTVGIAVAMTIAMAAAGALFQRDKARTATALGSVTSQAQHPTQPDDARELVLR